MKKLILAVFSLTASVAGIAQETVYFEVGPYEVAYKSLSDYTYRQRKGVNLYEFFRLKKDTIIQVADAASAPVTGALQVNASLSLPRYNVNGTSNVFGIDASWKQSIGQQTYFNAGVSLALSFGKYGEAFNYYKDWENESFTETMIEIGVPLSIELANLDYKKPSLYGGIGVVPTFYTGGKDPAGESKSGLFIAPRIDVGAYLPIGSQIARVGGFAQYNINCSGGDYDIFKERIGRLFVGASLGLVF